MRKTLFSVLALLAQWGIPTNAQALSPSQSPWPDITSGYLSHPPTRRLFFFISDPKDMGRPVVFGQPAQVPRTGGFLRPKSIANPGPQDPAHPTLKFPPTGLIPVETRPPQDFWRFRPKNSRLFFFTKP